MKINDVHITNWVPPGRPYWSEVRARKDEPLIEATIKMTLSWTDYTKLLKEADPMTTFGPIYPEADVTP